MEYTIKNVEGLSKTELEEIVAEYVNIRDNEISKVKDELAKVIKERMPKGWDVMWVSDNCISLLCEGRGFTTDLRTEGDGIPNDFTISVWSSGNFSVNDPRGAGVYYLGIATILNDQELKGAILKAFRTAFDLLNPIVDGEKDKRCSVFDSMFRAKMELKKMKENIL